MLQLKFKKKTGIICNARATGAMGDEVKLKFAGRSEFEIEHIHTYSCDLRGEKQLNTTGIGMNWFGFS